MINMVKLPTSKSELFLRVAKGHFATSHSHINYYIDVTTQKSRLSEAKAVAKELVSAYQHSTIVDTVLCLDGTQVIGTCLANELTKDGFTNMNAHKTIYIVTPEYTSGSQIILRDNLAPMVKGKHVLILAASITTGYTIQAAVESRKLLRRHRGRAFGDFCHHPRVSGLPGHLYLRPHQSAGLRQLRLPRLPPVQGRAAH
jgi:orotate phosphoribosyltransferase